MKIVGEFNNVSEQLKPQPLKRGEVATYRLLNGKLDPSRKDDLGRSVVSYPKSIRIPTLDRIWDEGKRAYVDIGVVQEFKGDNVTRTKAFYVSNGGDFENNGIFQLSGNSNEESELYEFFEISNYNASFEFRDSSVEPMFERVDFSKENKFKVKKIEVKADALTRVMRMTLPEMREFSAQMGWNEIAHEDEIRAKVFSFAEKHPEEFIKQFDDVDGATRSTIKQAITEGIIQYDASEHRYVWGKTEQTIAKLDRIDGKGHIEIFADWLLNAKNGSSIRNKIEQSVRGARKAKVGAAKDGVAE